MTVKTEHVKDKLWDFTWVYFCFDFWYEVLGVEHLNEMSSI